MGAARAALAEAATRHARGVYLEIERPLAAQPLVQQPDRPNRPAAVGTVDRLRRRMAGAARGARRSAVLDRLGVRAAF